MTATLAPAGPATRAAFRGSLLLLAGVPGLREAPGPGELRAGLAALRAAVSTVAGPDTATPRAQR